MTFLLDLNLRPSVSSPDNVVPPTHVAAAAPVLRCVAGRRLQHLPVDQPGRAEVPAHRGGARTDPQQAPHPQPAR